MSTSFVICMTLPCGSGDAHEPGPRVVDHGLDELLRATLFPGDDVDVEAEVEARDNHLTASTRQLLQEPPHVGRFGCEFDVHTVGTPEAFPRFPKISGGAPAPAAGRNDADVVAGVQLHGALVGHLFGTRLVAREEEPVLS